MHASDTEEQRARMECVGQINCPRRSSSWRVCKPWRPSRKMHNEHAGIPFSWVRLLLARCLGDNRSFPHFYDRSGPSYAALPQKSYTSADVTSCNHQLAYSDSFLPYPVPVHTNISIRIRDAPSAPRFRASAGLRRLQFLERLSRHPRRDTSLLPECHDMIKRGAWGYNE